MKKIVMMVATLALIGGMSSCKPKQSAYRAAYERAKQREMAQAAKTDQSATSADEITPISKSSDGAAVVVREKVRAAEGEDSNGLREYSVVIGSFQNITNARSLKERMIADGYKALIAMNDIGMYRVIASSYDTKEAAVVSRENIKARYPGQFNDAWLLYRQ